jgi:hypothetical protein
MNADPVGLPGTQRIALGRVLDFQHLGAEIGELGRDRVAGDEPRQVDNADAIKRACGGRIK